MESQLLQVNQQLSRAPDDCSLLSRKVRLDMLLADYYDDICEAARVKAGLKHHVDGEKPSKYFSALLKQRSSSSTITSLSCSRNGFDVSLTEIEDILEEASSFYAFLYSVKLTDVQKKEASPYLKKNVSSTLSEAQKAFCEHSISIEELGRALKKLPSEKAPGIDGLPAEFFKRYWHDLKSDFQSVLECSFKSGVLPDSMKLSVITLIFKKDSRADLKNYRPISLLCTDYKIIAKCLAENGDCPSISHCL